MKGLKSARWQRLFIRKHPHDPQQRQESGELRRCLNAFDLSLLGVGATIGAGIFVLTGIAAATKAGPAVMLSYALAALACALSALCYAELAAAIGGCGSAYGYAYAGLGEIFAWIIGWDLLLEYGLSTSTVAVGWSGYFTDLLGATGLNLPQYLLHGPLEHGIVNLPALGIILLVMMILILGAKESAQFNAIMVIIKLAVLMLFGLVAIPHFRLDLWHPFLPYGWTGVVSGAALIFFAYIGFDAVSTAAEETIHPERNLPIGILAALIICTLIYITVSGLLTGIMSYTQLNVSSPIAYALLQLGYRFVAGCIAVGAIAGLSTVILVMYYGFTRIFLAMTRDHLLPNRLARIHPRTHTPVRIIVIAGITMALIAGLIPIADLAHLVNIGTLAAFATVCLGTLVLRLRQPQLYRPFKLPGVKWVSITGVILCVGLMLSLPAITWINFLSWTVIGVVVYFCYSQAHASKKK
jgi:APA family basic amino acid/polyamine antiporter